MDSIFEYHLEVDDYVRSARGCSSEECDSFVSEDIYCAGDRLAQKCLHMQNCRIMQEVYNVVWIFLTRILQEYEVGFNVPQYKIINLLKPIETQKSTFFLSPLPNQFRFSTKNCFQHYNFSEIQKNTRSFASYTISVYWPFPECSMRN